MKIVLKMLVLIITVSSLQGKVPLNYDRLFISECMNENVPGTEIALHQTKDVCACIWEGVYDKFDMVSIMWLANDDYPELKDEYVSFINSRTKFCIKK